MFKIRNIVLVPVCDSANSAFHNYVQYCHFSHADTNYMYVQSIHFSVLIFYNLYSISS